MNIDEAMTIDEIKLFIEAVAARLGVTFQIEIDDSNPNQRILCVDYVSCAWMTERAGVTVLAVDGVRDASVHRDGGKSWEPRSLLACDPRPRLSADFFGAARDMIRAAMERRITDACIAEGD